MIEGDFGVLDGYSRRFVTHLLQPVDQHIRAAGEWTVPGFMVNLDDHGRVHAAAKTGQRKSPWHTLLFGKQI